MSFIANTYDAYSYFEDVLIKKGFRIVGKELRHRRHWFIVVSWGFKVYRLYMVFQRKPFYKFKEFFQEGGEALTINRDVLLRIIKERVSRLFWILEDGTIYFENPRYIMKLVTENGWSRRLEKTGELVVHVPIKYLKRVQV